MKKQIIKNKKKFSVKHKRIKKSSLKSLRELKMLASKTADLLVKDPKFKKKILKEIKTNPEFREIIITLTARRIFA